MTNTEISNAIANAFSNLSEITQVYDYWVAELYTADGEIIEEMWNENTLNRMEKDVFVWHNSI